MGAGGVLLLVLFYFLAFVMVFLPAAGAVIIEIMDRPRNIPSVTIGTPKNEKQIIMVYHPGASSFPSDVMRRLADSLAGSGYTITLKTAHAKLTLPAGKSAVIGLASPVYAGTIRPPLEKFIKDSDLKGRTCFIVLTGGDPSQAEKDTSKAASLVEERGGMVVDKVKLITRKDMEKVYEEIDQFVKSLVEKL